MSKQHIEQLIQSALADLMSKGKLSVEIPRIQIDATKDKQHGDFACNIALMLSKQAGCKPRELADMIVAVLPASANVTKVEIAGPGFINFFLSPSAIYSVITDIVDAGKNYGRANIGQGKKILVEFVSSNPTGPLHVGHGRHAAYGAVVSDLLETVGYVVHREYYVNDAGRQMDIVAVSVWIRYLQLNDEVVPFPANGYQGQYVSDIAHLLNKEVGHKLIRSSSDLLATLPNDETAGGDKELYIDAMIARAKALLGDVDYQAVLNFTLKYIVDDMRNDLEEFGVRFQEWFSERGFVQTDVVDRLVATLQKNGLIYEKDGASWFRSTDFGDDKDRVLHRANGQATNFVNDLAYHINKFERGFDFAIDIFGSDHHGYVPRMKAGLEAFGTPKDKLAYVFLQFVTLYRGDEQVPMSTRAGSFVTLRELRTEVGNDAARFFYVMRKGEQPMDFDLELAKSKSNENPVYYIQYAHARICSVFRQLAEKQLSYQPSQKNLELLTEPHELQLLGTLAKYPDMIVNAATQYEPHILTNYLRDVATDFHTYYNSHQFLVEDEGLRNARLMLIVAAQQVLVNGLTLLGVSAPDSM
jgi:arginyl-tRNA synthetase